MLEFELFGVSPGVLCKAIAFEPAIGEREREMKLIERELDASRKFYFDKYDGVDLPRLSLRNVALTEAMVTNNSSCMLSKSKGGVSGAGTGSDFWLDLMCEFQQEGEDPPCFTYQQVVEGTVKAIGRENSTHLNADDVGR